MPSSSSSASSTEHWNSTPCAPTAAPIRQATALLGASASTGTVVSISRNPNAAAVAASAASSSGSSRRLVTCAWLLGVRRARSFGHGLHQLGGPEQGEHPGELGRGGAGRQPHDLGPRHVRG